MVLPLIGVASLAEMTERLEAYLQELDQADQTETAAVPPERSVAESQAKIERLKTRQVKYQGWQKQRAETGESQLSLTDLDSRAVPRSPQAPVPTMCKRRWIANTI